MDACCKRIAELLRQNGQSSPRSLVKMVEKTELARSTVMTHLKHLERDSMLAKEEIIQGRVGRPKVLYKPSLKLLESFRTKSD